MFLNKSIDTISYQSMSLLTSVFTFSSLETKLISINSVSVYIYNPPLIDASTVKSRVNSFPVLDGLAFKAERTSDYSDDVRVSAEIIVIFSSLLNCWYSFWYLMAIPLM